MIGKKNIVFGFLYLVLTAALGPVMIVKYSGDIATAETAKQEKVSVLQQAAANNYEMGLEPMSPEQIAKTNSEAILAISARLNSDGPMSAIKSGPHTHGNLEALLNIVIGILLSFLAVHRLLKQAISWIFIVGTLAHSGLLYLAAGLQIPWAMSLMGTPVAGIGPVLILLGLFLAGISAALGFRGTIESDI